MTICITAASASGRDDEPPSVVICSDTQITHGKTGETDAFKNRFLVGGWTLAFAGLVREENETSRHIRKVFAENVYREINETNIRPLILEALSRRKREVARIKSKMAFGISYARLRKLARHGDPAVTAVLEDIASWSPEMDVHYIICGIHYGLTHMLETPPDGGFPVAREKWAIVGSSQREADAVFVRRKHSEVRLLGPTILTAYEAKKAAYAVDPTIGEMTTIGVLREGMDEPLYLKQEFIEELDRILAEQKGWSGPWPDIPSPPPEAYESFY